MEPLVVVMAPPPALLLPALPPLHGALSARLSSTLWPALSFLLLPLAALLLVELSLVYALLFLGQLLLAVAALEWSWLMFRVRQRLLLALDDDSEAPARCQRQVQAQVAVNSGELALEVDDLAAPLNSEAQPYAARLASAQRPRSFAVERMARWRGFCGCWAAPTAVLVAIGALLGVATAYWLADEAFKDGSQAWVMVVAATCEAAAVSVATGALAPTPGDGFVLVVYQGTVLAAAMNAYLRFRVALLADDQLVDSLYISLVGACALIVFRVISSRRVMASLLLVLGDVLGLLCLAAPLVTAADAIDRSPASDDYRQQIALFILVLTATDMGDALAHAVPWIGLPRCGRARPLLAKTDSGTRDVDAAFIAWCCAALTLGVARVVMGASVFNAVEVLVLLLAVGIGQWARLWISAVKKMANVQTTAFFLSDKSRAAGVLERVSLFMVAVLVYYPYVKDRFISDSVSSSGTSSSSSTGTR